MRLRRVLQRMGVVPEQTYEAVVPRYLRDIAEELGLEEPAWYVGRPPIESWREKV